MLHETGSIEVCFMGCLAKLPHKSTLECMFYIFVYRSIGPYLGGAVFQTADPKVSFRELVL